MHSQSDRKTAARALCDILRTATGMCVCVCVRAFVYVCMYVRVCVCVCLRVLCGVSDALVTAASAEIGSF